MKYIKYLLFLALCFPCYGEIKLMQQEQFAGKITQIDDEKIPDINCMDCLNVYTDIFGNIVKRNGSVLYNTSPYSGLKPIRNLGVYPLNSITSYLTINSSNSWSYILNGIPTAICNGLTISAIDDYTVAKGLMYRDNGVDGLGGKWDGSTYTPITVANSTQMVSGVYIKYWNNRLWKVGKNSSVAYYSRVNDPEYFDQTYQYVNVNVADGDIVTGMMIWNDRLIVTKKYAVYEIYESQPGVFLVRRLYNGIGCLYNTTMDILPNGLPVWMSYRGIEEFTGNSFNLISAPNERWVRSLPQFGDATLSYTDTTKAQWDAGASIQISTIAPIDSITVVVSTVINQKGNSQTSGIYNSVAPWQEFKSSFTSQITDIEISLTPYPSGTYSNISLTLSSGNIVGAGYTAYQSITQSGITKWNFTNYNITLTSGTAYRFTLGTLPGQASINYASAASLKYQRGEGQINIETPGTNSLCFNVYMILPTSASYTSGITNMNSLGLNTWTSWNSFNASCNIPTGVGYYVKVATATEVIGNAPYTAIGNGALINLTTGPFIQYRIETASSTMQVDDVTITANGEAAKPYGKVYNRRYLLAVTTNTATWSNSVVLCCQRTGDLTVFNNINASCFAVMKNELYYGDSTATGNIYKTDVANIYQDNGKNYMAYWRSKKYDFGLHLSEKDFRTLWVYGNPELGNMKIRWYLDDGERYGDFNFRSSDADVNQACQFPAWTRARHIQFMVYSLDDKPFSFKRYELTYKIWQPRKQ